MDRRRIFNREVITPVVVFLLSDTTMCKFIFHDIPVIKYIPELSAQKNEENEEHSEIKRRESALQEKVINVRSIYEIRTDRVQQKRRDQELG